MIQENILKALRKKGKRWEGRYHGDDTRFADLFNEYWVYPSENEKPKNAVNVEGGCYWG